MSSAHDAVPSAPEDDVITRTRPRRGTAARRGQQIRPGAADQRPVPAAVDHVAATAAGERHSRSPSAKLIVA